MAEFSTREILREATVNGRSCRLDRVSAGLEAAGSGTRRTEGYFAVRTYIDGSWHGRRFKSREDAEALFAQWTA
jgi:hypothetical protein